MQHTVRRSVLEPERTWSLAPDALRWDDPSGGGSIPLARVDEIRLAWEASRMDLARYSAHVTGAGQHVVIVSTHWAGVAQFEDRGATYGPLVRALVAAAARARPGVRLRAGATALAFALNAFAAFAGLAFLGVVVAFVPLPFDPFFVFRYVLLAALVPLAARWAWRNRPRPFDAAAVPEGVLPPV